MSHTLRFTLVCAIGAYLLSATEGFAQTNSDSALTPNTQSDGAPEPETPSAPQTSDETSEPTDTADRSEDASIAPPLPPKEAVSEMVRGQESEDASLEAQEPWDPLAVSPEDGAYVRFIKGEVKRIIGMNLFGLSSTLPEGYLTLKYDFTNTRAGSRFDEYGKRGPIINPISFAQNGEQIIKANLDVEGHGGSHGFALSYGILDELDAFFEVPFTFMTLKLTPKLDPVYTDEEGNEHTVRPTTVYPSLLGIEDTVGYNAQDFLYDTWPKLGRQSPANAYKGEWLMGDIGFGLMYNFFRNEHLSTAVRSRVTLPTGKVQDPNNSILYATGPAIETGLGVVTQCW